jgi:hypothetical protein
VVLRGDEDNYGQSALVHLTARAAGRSSASISTPSSPSGSGSSPAGSEHGSWAWSAPWWPARIGVAGQGCPKLGIRGCPGSR